jgi:branched-chain amino acid aminotransferase
MSIKSEKIWLNGKMVAYKDATMHFLNPSLHYGVGVFEGIRAYDTDKGPAVFRLKEHMQRFIESAKILGVDNVGYSLEELINAVIHTVRENKFPECYIRPLLYFGGESMGLILDKYEINIGIAVWEWANYLGEESKNNGVRACTSSFTRLHPNASMTKAKISGNYANSILAKTDSTRMGFNEAIMLDPEGYVSECTGENIFLVSKNQIIAASNLSTLNGITRDTIIQLVQNENIPIIEAKVSRDQLYAADEIFLCGTAAEVIGINQIDFRSIGNGSVGPITRKIQTVYKQAVHGMHHYSQKWLSYINPMD